ncbi:hypothetical protein [Caldimonas tepidiphila]|uniref:hypothetical protein n=1 Tax=Caldimonas tepidiphila TaxID=2315841 RepID=UPI000E5B88ED|nr:hypothetical protein [Caldimonas tepidiphila]
MSSQQTAEPANAETRFRQAFERLKDGQSKVLPKGTAVTQNNVAREAGCDPSALKKARFPGLIREIQAYLELHKLEDQPAAKKAARHKASRRSTEERLADAIAQRDRAQSQLLSANLRILELTDEVQSLKRRLDELLPPPMKLGRR